MKKKFVLPILIFLALSSIVVIAPNAHALVSRSFAADVLNGPCANTTLNTTGAENSVSNSPICKDNQPSGSNPIYSVIATVLKLLSYTIGFAAVVSVIIAGLRLILSGGDPETMKQVRNTIIYAVIGIIIAALAQVIVVFVLNKL